MTDFSNPSSARLRLSNAERDEAIASLEASARDGRLSDSELSERTGAVRSAVIRGDLAPLFADLPERSVQDGPAHANPPAAGAAPAAASGATHHEPSSYGAQPFRWRPVIQYVSPALSLVLFFVTGWIWGFQYSWIWFLLVPIAWGLSRGVDGHDWRDGRDRDRHQ